MVELLRSKQGDKEQYIEPVMWRPTTATEGDNNDRSAQFVTHVSVNDVLMGRGANIDKNEGNKRFRELVRMHRNEYMSTSRHQHKQEIATKILNEIVARGGSFLKKVENPIDRARLKVPNGVDAWYYVPKDVTIRKIKQALRGEDKKGEPSSQTNLVTTSNSTLLDNSEHDVPSSLSSAIDNESMEAVLRSSSASQHVATSPNVDSRLLAELFQLFRGSGSNQHSLLELASTVNLATANHQLAPPINLQHVQNQALLSQRLLQNREEYKSQTPTVNREILLLSEVEAAQRNILYPPENARPVDMQDYQSLIARFLPPGMILQGSQPAMNVTFENVLESYHRSSFTNPQLGDHNQQSQTRPNLQVNAQSMISNELIRSSFSNQSAVPFDVTSNEQYVDISQSPRNNQNMAPVAERISEHQRHAVGSSGVGQNDRQYMAYMEHVASGSDVLKRQKSSPSSSSSSDEKRRHRVSKHARKSDR
jgi:hypothetical protein